MLNAQCLVLHIIVRAENNGGLDAILLRSMIFEMGAGDASMAPSWALVNTRPVRL